MDVATQLTKDDSLGGVQQNKYKNNKMSVSHIYKYTRDSISNGATSSSQDVCTNPNRF